MNNFKEAKKAFVRQIDQSDCGVACLRSIINYYGGESTNERIRELSGTNQSGTTMLGLLQAGKKLGLDISGFEAEIHHLETEVNAPCILHILKDERLQHYIVFYGNSGDQFIISDPAEGIKKVDRSYFEHVWQSKALLLVNKSTSFRGKSEQRQTAFKWIKDILKPDINRLTLALLTGVVISLLNLSIAIYTQQLLDYILPEGKFNLFIVGLLIVSFFLLIKNVLTYLRTRFLLEQSRDFNNRVVDFFLNKLLYLPISFFDNRTTGDFVARLNDTSRLQRVISYLIGDLGIQVLLALSSLGLIFYYSIDVGIIMLIAVPCYISTMYYFKNSIIEKQRSVLQAYAKNENNFIDVITGIEAIKGGNKESLFARISLTIYHFYQERQLNLGMTAAAYTIITAIISTLFLVLVIFYAGSDVLNKLLPLGYLIAIIQMSGQFLPSIQAVIVANIQIQEAKVVYDRMTEFTNLEPEGSIGKISKIPTVETILVQHINFRFPGRKPILNNMSMSLARGTVTSLIGDSGSGKSTLIKLLSRFYELESGSILINNKFDLQSIDIFSWRSSLAILEQEPTLFEGSVAYNIVLDDDEAQAKQKLLRCSDYGFDTMFSQFSQGYLTQVGKHGSHLSGGQKQLVALARAIVQKPQILLLDEPTSSMDRSMQEFTYQLLQKIKSNMTILIVTHNITTCLHSDLIYELNGGNITFHGDFNFLSKQDGSLVNTMTAGFNPTWLFCIKNA